MEITPYPAAAKLRANMLQFPVIYETQLSGGPTSGDTPFTLGTVNVPALPVPTIHVVRAFWNSVPDVDGRTARWQFLIVDGSSTIAAHVAQFGGGAQRLPWSLGDTPSISVGVGVAKTYKAEVSRSAGTGTINTLAGGAYSGNLTVLVLPDPASMAVSL